MTIDEISDAAWFLSHNPPAYALLGDFFGVRKRAESPTGSADDLRRFNRMQTLPASASGTPDLPDSGSSTGFLSVVPTGGFPKE